MRNLGLTRPRTPSSCWRGSRHRLPASNCAALPQPPARSPRPFGGRAPSRGRRGSSGFAPGWRTRRMPRLPSGGDGAPGCRFHRFFCVPPFSRRLSFAAHRRPRPGSACPMEALTGRSLRRCPRCDPETCSSSTTSPGCARLPLSWIRRDDPTDARQPPPDAPGAPGRSICVSDASPSRRDGSRRHLHRPSLPATSTRHPVAGIPAVPVQSNPLLSHRCGDTLYYLPTVVAAAPPTQECSAICQLRGGRVIGLAARGRACRRTAGSFQARAPAAAPRMCAPGGVSSPAARERRRPMQRRRAAVPGRPGTTPEIVPRPARRCRL